MKKFLPKTKENKSSYQNILGKKWKIWYHGMSNINRGNVIVAKEYPLESLNMTDEICFKTSEAEYYLQ